MCHKSCIVNLLQKSSLRLTTSKRRLPKAQPQQISAQFTMYKHTNLIQYRKDNYIQDRRDQRFKKLNFRETLTPYIEKVKTTLNLSQKPACKFSQQTYKQQQRQWKQQLLIQMVQGDPSFAKQIIKFFEILCSPLLDLSNLSQGQERYDFYFETFKHFLLGNELMQTLKVIGIAFEKCQPFDGFFECQKSYVFPPLVELFLNECAIEDYIGSLLTKANLKNLMKLSIHNDKISNKGVKQLMSLQMTNICDLSIRNSKITTDSLKIFQKGVNQMKYLSVAYNDNFSTNETLKVLYCILNKKDQTMILRDLCYIAEKHKIDYCGFLTKIESQQYSSDQLNLTVLQSLSKQELRFTERFHRKIIKAFDINIRGYRGIK